MELPIDDVQMRIDANKIVTLQHIYLQHCLPSQTILDYSARALQLTRPEETANWFVLTIRMTTLITMLQHYDQRWDTRHC
jgi:hypothetical protein